MSILAGDRREPDRRPSGSGTGTGGRKGRRRRAEGGNMKKPNREGWALYGTPEAGRKPDRRPPGRRVRNRNLRPEA